MQDAIKRKECSLAKLSTLWRDNRVPPQETSVRRYVRRIFKFKASPRIDAKRILRIDFPCTIEWIVSRKRRVNFDIKTEKDCYGVNCAVEEALEKPLII